MIVVALLQNERSISNEELYICLVMLCSVFTEFVLSFAQTCSGFVLTEFVSILLILTTCRCVDRKCLITGISFFNSWVCVLSLLLSANKWHYNSLIVCLLGYY